MTNVAEIVRAVIRNHPSDCVFLPDTVQRCVEACRNIRGEHEIIDVLATMIRNCEIYCPHEGIDRRVEFGLEAP